MTVKEAKEIIKNNADRPILPGSIEMKAILVLAIKNCRNKS